MEIKVYDDFKKLTHDEQNYYIYDQLIEIPKLCDLDNRYANKWVERWFTKVIATVSLAFLAAIIALVLK